MQKFDFLVIGSGIAGLTYALKIAEAKPEAKIGLVTKADENESNTKYAQGGIAVVTDRLKDSYEKHVQDSLKAGDGQCDERVVRMVVEEGPKRVDELLRWEVDFDKQHSGDFELGLEGGHTANRILHHKDKTGLEIERKLLARIETHTNVQIFENHLALELISEKNLANPQKKASTCFGAYVLNLEQGKIDRFLAKMTMLATGGAGQVYQTTTNPEIATGDGIAMAARLGAAIKDIEFVQFHPTALNNTRIRPAFLISEAVRGFGAKLKNRRGEYFMKKYDERGELASRDIVSRAIDTELKTWGDESVYLDCTHLEEAEFKRKFPIITEKLASVGLDPAKNRIPVVPAAHYLCGGIDVDAHGQTNIGNLLACGECARTGLHGANRLASNSLLEALVFAHRSFEKSLEHIDEIDIPKNIRAWKRLGTVLPKEHVLISHSRKEVERIMKDYVGIVRSNERLKRAATRLNILRDETESLYRRTRISPQIVQLRNSILVAELMVAHSLKRTKNVGVFFKLDNQEPRPLSEN